MKHRNGFVSNSSASSFVIPKESGLSTIDVATQVFEQMVGQYDQYGDPWSVANRMTYDTVVTFFNENKGYDGNILIPWTTNYETWIFRNSSGKLCIDTCNNIDWDGMCFTEEPDVEYLEEGHEATPWDFIPTYRQFLDLDDMRQKRKSQYDSERYAHLGMGFTYKEGENWRDWDEEDDY